MTTKVAAANSESKQNASYRAIIDDCLREFKEIQKEIRRQKAETERLRSSTHRKSAETWEILRRVEANR